MTNSSEWIGIFITLSAFWHVLGFSFGLVYIIFSFKSLLGIIPYNRLWSRVIRSSDVHLWLSGFALIGLGVLQKGFEPYIANPKLWCKVTVVVVWFLSTQCIRRYGVPQLGKGNTQPILHLSAINISCWIYGAILGCAKPLAHGVVSYTGFLAGYGIVLTLSFVVVLNLSRHYLPKIHASGMLGIQSLRAAAHIYLKHKQ